MDPLPRQDLTPAHLLSPVTVLFVLLLGTFLGLLVATLLGAGLSHWLDIEAIVADADNADAGQRNRVRLVLLTGQLFTFFVPGLLLARWLYGRAWGRALALWPRPTGLQLLVGVLLLFSGAGLVLFAYQLNQEIPLPDWAVVAEERSAGMLELVLRMESPAELLLSLLIVAVLAAVGEELLFRGLLQPTLARWFGGREQAAIWATALIFSAVHFQFEGFLPRLVLGVLLGYLFVLSGRLWVPIVAHLLHNGVQVVGTYTLSPEAVQAAAEQAPVVTPLQAGCSLLLVLLGAFALQRISRPSVPTVPTSPPDE